MKGLPRLPLTVFGGLYARRRQSLARNRREYVDLANDRQRRSFTLVREQHALNITRAERCNSALSDGLNQVPTYAVGASVRIYNTVSTIRPSRH